MPRVRDPILLAAATLLLLAAGIVVQGSASWLGRSFPGFLVLENRVVPSAGLAHWPATQGGKIYQHEIVAVDGVPLRDAASLAESVAAREPGSTVRYRFRHGDAEFERDIPVRRFERLDYALLFGSLLLNGLALGITALLIRYLRGRDVLALGSFPILWIAGMWALSAVDLYGPYRLFRLHALCECLLFAGTFHMALVFPRPSRLVRKHPRVVWVPYGLAGALALVNQIGLYDPDVYRLTHAVATSAFGASLVFFIASQVRAYLRAVSFEARQRVKLVAFGTVVALTPQVVVTLGSAVTGGETSHNVMAFSGIVYPLCIGYAVLRHNLLQVDVFVRRSLGYALFTGLVTLSYVGAIQLVEALSLRSGRDAERASLAFLMLCVLLLLPLRDRVQGAIDRIFFRDAYDFRRIVETTSARLAAVADLRAIAIELSRAVGETLHPERSTLYVRRGHDGDFEPVGEPVDPSVVSRDLAVLRRVGAGPTDARGRGLAVPFQIQGELVAVLVLGRPLSGGFYGGDDRRLLQTLANQGGVAIRKALALEQLRELNRNLEAVVAERTSELRDAHAQLVHQEKMASLGQFVAGIAHELNNPLNFIQGNLFFLREYMDALVAAMAGYEKAAAGASDELSERFAAIRSDREIDDILAEVDSVFEGCAEGVDRSTTLVRDLRTFSRLDQAERVEIDLHEVLESTLNLLRSKLTGIEVVKEYGELPRIQCLAGQIEQVLMNLIANAADAVGDGGTITVRTRTRPGGVVIEVQDDGCGIPAEHQERIFDPFFTSKEVGKGTGLGLSISYGIVSRHKGSIQVESREGEGTLFRIDLPGRQDGP